MTPDEHAAFQPAGDDPVGSLPGGPWDADLETELSIGHNLGGDSGGRNGTARSRTFRLWRYLDKSVLACHPELWVFD